MPTRPLISLPRSLAVWCAIEVALIASGTATAQIVTLAPSAALQCMTPPAQERGKPEYPAELAERKLGGSINVELVFARADAAPQLRLLNTTVVDQQMVASVQRHVAKLRVPCLPEGAEPARLIMDFAFIPGDGRRVYVSRPRDPVESAQWGHDRCLTRIAGPERPDYPRAALRAEQEGKFLVRLRFASPTAPPEPRFVAGPDHRPLRQAMAEWASNFRLPCQKGEPAEVDIVFDFRFVDGARTIIKDMSLLSFLRGAEHIPRPAYFNLDELGCPFDVRIEYYQPFKASLVAHLGAVNSARRPFLEWLADIRMRIPESTALEVLGEKFVISVPCGKVDL